MRSYARQVRPMVCAGLGLLVAAGGLAPARAEFFFPFFDNRPSTPPRAEPRQPRRHRSEGVIDLRRKPHTHHSSPHLHGVAPSQPAEAAKPPETATAAVEEGPPPPYEPQLLRLSEIMGALSYLQSLCVEPTATKAKAGDQPWRETMQKLMSAEATGAARREKLAGAYNRGLQGYEYSYRTCTPSARLARQRYLDEGARIAHDIAAQYRAN